MIAPELLEKYGSTIDSDFREHFEGENVETLKRCAHKMGTFLFVSMFEHQKKYLKLQRSLKFNQNYFSKA